jgi:hypothetical protein
VTDPGGPKVTPRETICPNCGGDGRIAGLVPSTKSFRCPACLETGKGRPTFGDLAEMAAGTLPPGWEICVRVEREAGWVDLINPDLDEVDFPSNRESIEAAFADALEFATGEASRGQEGKQGDEAVTDLRRWIDDTFTRTGGKMRIGRVDYPVVLTREDVDVLMDILACIQSNLPTLDQRLRGFSTCETCGGAGVVQDVDDATAADCAECKGSGFAPRMVGEKTKGDAP